jgi:hypothetical protein
LPLPAFAAVRAEAEALVTRAEALVTLELIRQRRQRTTDPELREAARRLDLVKAYQAWLTAASALVRRLAPDRLAELEACYRPPERTDITPESYGIADYLLGIAARRPAPGGLDGTALFAHLWRTQAAILASALDRLESVLGRIEGALLADLLDRQLADAEDLLRKGHARAAAALAGLVLERHLSRLAADLGLTFRRLSPSVPELSGALQKAGALDAAAARQVGRLAAAHEACLKADDREAAQDLLAGVADLLAPPN